MKRTENSDQASFVFDKEDACSPSYRLGCPAWAHAPWKGHFFRDKTPSRDFLKEYASVFKTVEGNTTFYGVPKSDTILKWREQVPSDFRFCFKFPQWISHRRPFRSDTTSAESFLKSMEPLKDVMGPVFLQIPATLGPESLLDLESFFSALPGDFHYALEPRHPDFFRTGSGPTEDLNSMLEEMKVDRVIFETRPLFRTQWKDPDTLDAIRKKPKESPIIHASGKFPIVRFVTNMEPEIFESYLELWTDVFAEWIQQGKQPCFMAHTPDDTEAPKLARIFQRKLNQKLSEDHQIEEMLWPVEKEKQSVFQPSQLNLFDF